MSRWTNLLWRALTVLGEANPTFNCLYPTLIEEAGRAWQPLVDLSDDASVRESFRSIVEREWGRSALGNEWRR
ncbi:hypothetical protein [Micromonospora zamorensis]|uniref:hypothetical protein n=1 Tax=Micromonospora zamorensis TaxID=709883 RepID=UPI003CEB798C